MGSSVFSRMGRKRFCFFLAKDSDSKIPTRFNLRQVQYNTSIYQLMDSSFNSIRLCCDGQKKIDYSESELKTMLYFEEYFMDKTFNQINEEGRIAVHRYNHELQPCCCFQFHESCCIV